MKEDQHAEPGRLIRFGAIELDVRAAEIRKHGLKIRLHKQSFQILLMLLEFPGEVVLREEIRKKLWPNDTVVEFDHSINAAVQKLRETLGESAEKPRYVETVARQGYRFIGTVEAAPEEPVHEPPQAGDRPQDDHPSSWDIDVLSGKTFSHFRVIEKLGSGGMGVVYRAEDLNLGRQVALKFLSLPATELCTQLYERFQREARAASALNHPNICTIYGVEEFAGQPVIVMELVEGETLAARLAKGALPLDQALAAAIQIASALDAAHRKGIVHRDLKPANVMVTKSGVKVLDFGLAKMDRAVTVGDDALGELTEKGSILGTLHYMSPEQVQGKNLDARSDLFSFGLVLYEMVTGRRAFEGENSASLLAAILTSQPAPISEVDAPAALDRVLWRCLAKDPDDRWQTARDLKAELVWIAAPPVDTTSQASSGRWKRSARRLTAATTIAAAFLVAAAVTALVYLRNTPQTPPMVRYSVPLPPNTRFLDYGHPIVGYPVVSPNGERIAVALAPSVGERTQIWIYQMSTGEFLPMAGTDGAFEITWSPDSGSVVFWANQKYNRLDLSVGAINAVVEEPRYGRPAIAPNGSMLVSTNAGLELVATSGERRPVTSRKQNDPFDYFPALLPNSNRFLFLQGIFPPVEIWRGNLDGSAPARLDSADSQAEYSDSGHLLFVRGNTLFAQPFDPGNAVASGRAQPLVNGVARLVGSSLAGFSVSRNGVLAFRPGTYSNATRLTWLDRDGKELGTLGEVADYYSPELSPDGKRVAVMIRDLHRGKRDIWVFDLVRGNRSRLTFDPADHVNPTWSPDGERIAFTSTRKGMRDIYVISASGGQDEVVIESKRHKSVEDWSADGKFLIFDQLEQKVVVDPRPFSSTENQADIYVLPLSGADRRPIAFVATPFREDHSRMSPDGRWIAYGSNESGVSEVYVQPFPANGKRYQISTAGGEEPQWRGDSKELFYVEGTTVMSAEIRANGGELGPGIPKKLFDVHLTSVRARNRLAIAKDGQRFLAAEAVDEDPRAPFTVILNWPRLLDKR